MRPEEPVNAKVVEHPAHLRSTPEQAMRACIRVLSQALATRVDLLLESLDDELIDRADAAQSEDLRQPYFQAVQFLRRQAEDIREAFTHLAEPEHGDAAARGASAAALDEDQELALDTMVRRFDRAFGTSLGRLRDALATGGRKAPEDVRHGLSNLIDANAIALTWAHRVAGLQAASGMHLILLKRFEREVLQALGPALAEAAALLEGAVQSAARDGAAVAPSFDPDELAAPPETVEAADLPIAEVATEEVGIEGAASAEWEARGVDTDFADLAEVDTAEVDTAEVDTAEVDTAEVVIAGVETDPVESDEFESWDVGGDGADQIGGPPGDGSEVDAGEFDITTFETSDATASEVRADDFEVLDDDIDVDRGGFDGDDAARSAQAYPAAHVPEPRVDAGPSATSDGVEYGATDVPGELIADWSEEEQEDELELREDTEEGEGSGRAKDGSEPAAARVGMRGSFEGTGDDGSGDADQALLGLVDDIQERLLVRLRDLELDVLPEALDLGALLLRALQGAAGADATLPERATAIVGVVQRVYAQVLADEDLGVPLRALLVRTQLPMLRQALADPSVLSAQRHALRELLDLCVEVAVDFTRPQSMDREPVLRAVLATLDALADAPDSPPEDLDTLREELAIIADREAGKIERVTRRTFSNEVARIEADLTRSEVSRLIEQRANYIDDRGLMKFIEHDWQLVLFRVRQARGVASREWRDALRVLCRLTRGPGIQAGELHQALIEGLRYLGRSQENATRDATAALSRMIENDNLGSGTAPAVTLPSESEAGADAVAENDGENGSVEGVPFGSWLVLPGAGGTPRRGRLAGASGRFGVCVIVDGRGRLSETLTSDEFAQGVAAGTIRALDVADRFERALDTQSG
jgi:hypothetical protein